MWWIMNQKRYRPGYFCGSVLVLAAEMTLLNICMLLFAVVAESRNTDWYRVAMEQQASQDLFAGVKDRNIFIALSVAVGFVTVFAVVSLCVVRRLQLEYMQKQIGVSMICGYTKKQIQGLLHLDMAVDVFVATSCAIPLSDRLLWRLTRREEFQVMLSVINENGKLVYITVLASVLVVLTVAAIYEKWWLEKVVKGDMVSLIRQNG